MIESFGRKVVIVEDEGLIAADLQGRLERLGYQVPGIAASGSEALRIIRAKTPDLILMDIRLAGPLDGIQVAEKVRTEFDIPVVYLTAFEDQETLQRAGQSQAFGYIRKPIATASLQGSIEMAIAKHLHERNVRAQRDWFSASLSALPDAVLVTDGSGCVRYLNPMAGELLRCKVADAVGRRSAEVLRFTYSDGHPVEDFVPVVMLHGGVVSLPSDIWFQDGSLEGREIEGAASPLWEGDRIKGVVITFQDVTLRKFEEEQSSQDKKYQALERLADGISVQLQMELSAVSDASGHVLRSLSPEGVLRSSLETIQGAAREALEVANCLHAFAGAKEMQPRLVKVNEILKSLQAVWKDSLPRLTLTLDENPRTVQADIIGLTKALDLILEHARLRMDRSREITIVASDSERAGQENWLSIRIAYSSTEEDASVLERIFDPSWDGNWEGLPLAYGLIKRMGGLISARIQGNARVIFEIDLPSIQIEAAGLALEQPPEPAILLIDPNALSRLLLHAHFAQHGYKVLEAANCSDALRLAESCGQIIRIALANPAPDDQHRATMAQTLLSSQPVIRLRLFEGYWEEGFTEEKRYLTKWGLLQWANCVLEASDKALAAK